VLSTNCFAHLAALSFEIVFDWKLSLTRVLRLIALAHWTTKCPFSLAQEQNFLGFFLPWDGGWESDSSQEIFHERGI